MIGFAPLAPTRRLLLAATLALAALLAVPAALRAQRPVTVSPLEPTVYDALERLVALGASDAMLGQQPFTRGQLADIAARALADSSRVDLSRRAELRALVAIIDSTALRDRRGADWLSAEWIASDAVRRAVPYNGLSGIDAQVAPLLDARLGTEPPGAHGVSLSGAAVFGTDRVAIVAQPRLTTVTDGGSVRQVARVDRLYGIARLGNALFLAGRDYLKWGQGDVGSLFLSGNAGPMDQLRISSASPWRLPSKLRGLGQWRTTFVVAALGGDYDYPHAHLLAYKFSLEPIRGLELGANYMNISGGHGSPEAPAWKRIIDSFAFFNLFRNDTSFSFSNKLAGLEARYSVPATGTQVYAEWLLDDFDWRKPMSSFWRHDGGGIFGLHQLLPALSSGTPAARLEFHHTGARLYQHGEWLSGYTMHHRLLGNDLGPDGNAGYLTLDMLHGARSRTALGLALEERSGDIYHETSHLDGPASIDRTQRLPKERRLRLTMDVDRPLGQRLALESTVGYERATNFGFVSRGPLNQYLARLALVARF